ncbi:phosphate signaling complex protein PhoU [Jeotgalicoccus sp. FSL K6-3177]|uniref:phosphate signaling complex protein PhoU n=1 Tax=Jeotgalicoccus sp. FSL K6-3177 TaxID=2921494 RepID=UPI0030FDE637
MTVYREKFQEELDALIGECIKLGEECHKRLAGTVEVLLADDIEDARKVVHNDAEINKMEADVNAHAINLITTQQPVATDLRTIISCIKIADNLERIGDNISNVAEVRKRIKITNERTLLRFKTMERLASLMLEDVYTAFKKSDLDLLDEIILRDQDIDAVFVQITTSDIFEESDAFLTGQIQLTAKYLERIGDHIKSIAEHIYYIHTGDPYEKYKSE